MKSIKHQEIDSYSLTNRDGCTIDSRPGEEALTTVIKKFRDTWSSLAGCKISARYEDGQFEYVHKFRK